MKRRDFLQGLAASAGAAIVPMPALAKVATPTTAKVIPFHYGWATVFARKNNGISAADLQRVFRISRTDASGLMDRMLSRGVISPPGLDGRSQPTKTWQPWEQRTAATPTKRETSPNRDVDENAKNLAELFRAVMAPVLNDPSFGWAA